MQKCMKIYNCLRCFFSETCKYDENLTVLVKTLNTPLLTIVTKNSISDMVVVLDTSLEQLPLAALF